jgi:two-component system cell cycle sensor histidine kinase PleC
VASFLTCGPCAGVALAANPLPIRTAVVLLLVLLLANTVAVFSNYNQELHIRRDFRLNKLLVIQKGHSEELARSAMEAGDAKTHFLAMMSYALRTPLNAIIGFAEIIAKQMFGPVRPDRYREYADDIDRSDRRLLTMINSILDLSRAAEGKPRTVEDKVGLA